MSVAGIDFLNNQWAVKAFKDLKFSFAITAALISLHF